MSGVQKIGDGAPVKAANSMFVRYLHPPADPRVGLLARHHPRRRVAIPTMPIAQYPALAPPQITVTAIYIGANAQEVETAVTTPLEQAINGVEGMLYMTSSSTNSGFSTHHHHVRHRPRSGLRAVDVQNRVRRRSAGCRPRSHDRHHGQQGDHRLRHGGRRVRREGWYDSLFLSNYTDVYVKDALKRVPGVGDVIIFGERKYSMRLWLDPRPARRARRSPPATSSARCASRTSRSRPAASASRRRRPGRCISCSVRVEGRLPERAEFDNIIVKAGADGSLVRLKDVGRAELGAENYAVAAALPGQEAVGFGVIQLPTANALDVSRGVARRSSGSRARSRPGMRCGRARHDRRRRATRSAKC